jgi:DNA polymerase III subunit epsilon
MTWPMNLEFCILDFETTGLFPQFGDRIVEYAFLVVKNGQIIDRGEGLVNPNRPMDPGATNANGITDEMLRGKPRFDQVGSGLWHAIKNRVFVAHNARFDLNCFAHECKKVGWKQPDFQAIDSLKLSRSLWTGQINNKLETLANMVGHSWSGDAHRAMADVEALFTIMNSLFSQFPNKLNSLDALLRIGGIDKTNTDPLPSQNMSRAAQILLQNIGSPIDINYASKSSGNSTRTITPGEVFVNNNVEFVDAYCHKRMENRTFRIDRISNL